MSVELCTNQKLEDVVYRENTIKLDDFFFMVTESVFVQLSSRKKIMFNCCLAAQVYTRISICCSNFLQFPVLRSVFLRL